MQTGSISDKPRIADAFGTVLMNNAIRESVLGTYQTSSKPNATMKPISAYWSQIGLRRSRPS
jgi:hypothetical protein